MRKRWYDYLWIVSLLYLILGFFNILFAWLGLACFLIPLMISLAKGTKGYCNRYCGRGQLFQLLGGRFGFSRRRDIPKWMKSKGFRYGFLAFFLAMFLVMLWNTCLVFAGTQELSQTVTLLWRFRLPWHWAYHGTIFHKGVAIRIRVLQCDADIHHIGNDYNGTFQAQKLVCLLPDGHDDTAGL